MRALRRHRIIAVGGIGALLACVGLMTLALIPHPPFEMDHAAILSGTRPLNAGEVSLYLTYLERNLTVDSFYLLGHIAMWIGYSQLLKERRLRFAGLITVFGLLSGALDFLENEVRWAVAGSLKGKGIAAADWTVAWQVVVGMSFWAVLVTIGLTAVMIWGRGRFDRLMSVLGLASLLSVGSIYTSGYFPTFICMVVWHGASGIYLWRSASFDERHEGKLEGGVTKDVGHEGTA